MVLARLSRAGAVDGCSGRDCRVPVEGRSWFREDGLSRDWGIWELHGIAPDVSHPRGGGGGTISSHPGSVRGCARLLVGLYQCCTEKEAYVTTSAFKYIYDS